MDYINVISSDFKIAKHEYDKETKMIGAQCSEKVYPDNIVMMRNSNKFQSYHFNLLTLACLANMFDKEDLMLLYRMLNYTHNTEFGTYFTVYETYEDKCSRIICKPCNLYRLAEAFSVPFDSIKRICDILIRDNVLYEFDCYTDRYHTRKDKMYIFNSDFMNYADGSWFREDEWWFDEDGVLLWYQSMVYDAEYQANPELFNQRCKNGWRGEKILDGDDRNSPQYRKWIKDVTDRDKVCQCCGSSMNIDIHHIKPYATHKKLRVDVDNGIALCELHHSSMVLGGFHQTYGTRNNTPEQLLEYIKTKRNELGITDTSFIKSPFLLEHIEEI